MQLKLFLFSLSGSFMPFCKQSIASFSLPGGTLKAILINQSSSCPLSSILLISSLIVWSSLPISNLNFSFTNSFEFVSSPNARLMSTSSRPFYSSVQIFLGYQFILINNQIKQSEDINQQYPLITQIKSMLKIFASLSFCTAKNYTSTFKIRSRLSEFFKHVHPDQLSQAPVKVKEENLKSLTNFNSYIDSISQSKPTEAKLLKFYIAEKTNLKSKKFFSFTVELPQITAGESDMPEEKAKKLVDNIIEVLNKKFVQSKSFRTKHGKITDEKIQKGDSIKFEQTSETEQQRINRMSSTIKPFNRKSQLSQHSQQTLKSALNQKYLQAQKQSLSSKLRQSITFANTGTHKPMWSRVAGEQSGIYKEYQDIMDQLIDPRLLYFDQSLTGEEIQEFKKRLLPGSMSREAYKNSKIIIEVCAKMESFEPPLCFYISRKYSSTEIPGFLTIPYNFKAPQLASYFQKQIQTVLTEQQKFQQYYDYYKDLHSQLQAENNLVVDEAHFKNNSQIWERILMMKRLQRYRVQGGKVGLVAFGRDSFGIFRERYGGKGQGKAEEETTAVVYEGKIVVRVDFSDVDMERVINEINRKQA